ncbi:conserved hypothetical protein [Candidatus Sulfopaludibacter sp. SbA4]|nr:conserved hypothetical protein [Candidatus Sulfopaludibacter sp. SbA4]
MLYDSTKNLLQSILQALETGDETQWDDQTESGNACLYEMHQMSSPLYKAYRPDALHARALAQANLPEKLNRAMPHVRLMVIAIRHRERTRALESGKAALAEMNKTSLAIPAEPRTERTEASAVRRHEKSTGDHGLRAERPRSSRRIRVSSAGN